MVQQDYRFSTRGSYSSGEEELRDRPKVWISGKKQSSHNDELDIYAIQTLDQLNEKESEVIKFFKVHDKASANESRIKQARQLIEQFRRETLLQLHVGSSPAEGGKVAFQAGHQPFDRLLYLLDRYTEYSNSIGLSAWPIHYLKVAIWIKGDVISLKSRVVPLRKTVRCYITTMETVRVKTQHLFPIGCKGQDWQLLTSGVLRELLDVLPITRSSSNDGSSETDLKEIGGVDRDSVLAEIRKNSGDSKASEALSTVQASRNQTNNPHGLKFTKKKPDPHIHTLNRYQHFCTSNRIPIWPIEPLRVSIWLKDSVLSTTSREYSGFKVSLRTVQVYLSRLEYARLRTEPIFKDEFGELATGSLYRSQAIMDVLESFAPHSNKKSNTRESSFSSEEDQIEPEVEEEVQVVEVELPEYESRKRKYSSYHSTAEERRPILHHTQKIITNIFASRPGISQCRNTFRSEDEEEFEESASEDSDESRYSPRPRSSSSESFCTSSSDADSFSSAGSEKGRLSYILCSDSESAHSTYQNHTIESRFGRANLDRSVGFSVAPLMAPKEKPRFVIPSIDSFVFAFHDR